MKTNSRKRKAEEKVPKEREKEKENKMVNIVYKDKSFFASLEVLRSRHRFFSGVDFQAGEENKVSFTTCDFAQFVSEDHFVSYFDKDEVLTVLQKVPQSSKFVVVSESSPENFQQAVSWILLSHFFESLVKSAEVEKFISDVDFLKLEQNDFDFLWKTYQVWTKSYAKETLFQKLEDAYCENDKTDFKRQSRAPPSLGYDLLDVLQHGVRAVFRKAKTIIETHHCVEFFGRENYGAISISRIDNKVELQKVRSWMEQITAMKQKPLGEQILVWLPESEIRTFWSPEKKIKFAAGGIRTGVFPDSFVLCHLQTLCSFDY